MAETDSGPRRTHTGLLILPYGTSKERPMGGRSGTIGATMGLERDGRSGSYG